MTCAITTWRRAAFALPELAATLVIVGVAIAMLLVGAGRARLEHNSAAQNAQLRWIAGVTASYAADFQDRQWGLSWKEGRTPSAFPDLARASSHYEAAQHQAVDILRRRADRLDIPPSPEWAPSLLYSHLPLADYLDKSLPLLNFVPPTDEHQLKWARDPGAFDRGEFLPLQPEPTEATRRWPYRSSYEMPPALVTTPWSGPEAMYSSGSHSWFYMPSAMQFEGIEHSAITFPSQKVQLYDREQRIGKRRWFMHDDADIHLLMADGSAMRRRTADANLSWYPLSPTVATRTRLPYEPRPWEPQFGAGEHVDGRYRWTRCGPEGRDFGGRPPCEALR